MRLHVATVALLAGGLTVMVPGSGSLLAQENRWIATTYCIDPDYWNGPPNSPSTCPFPEAELLRAERPFDLGVAFSGGGSRAASATIGQLRGLLKNGWLDRVRYVSAVSGGAWAAIPFTYSYRPREALLGTDEDSGCHAYSAEAACGLLAATVADSRVLTTGLKKYLGDRFMNDAAPTGWEGPPDRDQKPFDDLLKRILPGGQRNDTFTTILARVFLSDDICGGCAARPSTWDPQGGPWRLNQSFPHAVRPMPDRPYLIVGGTLIDPSRNYAHPRIFPLEMTPDYVGVRQRFDPHIGGGYVSSWAYGMGLADRGTGTQTPVVGEPREFFTIQDAAAISGSAPLLAMFAGTGRDDRQRQTFAEFFPIRDHWTARDRGPGPVHRRLPHGDGGFTDNLGIMPLLARQVRNIIVFVNAANPAPFNEDLEGLFRPVATVGAGGDKSRNVVFDSHKYEEVLGAIYASGREGTALACDVGWHVKPNPTYNIRAYGPVNICFIYNQRVESWWNRLPKWVREDPELDRFPWYRTFFEQRGLHAAFIDLSVLKVNLLAAMSEWNLTNTTSRRTIEGALGPVLPGR